MTPQELKNSILQRAIEGKLVDQRPEEGSGEELLTKIYDEVEFFVNLNKIKKNDRHIKTGEDDNDFEVPENWGKIRLGEICFLLNGKKENKKSYPYLEVKYLRGNIEPKIKTSGKVVNADTNIILMDGENSGEVFKTREVGYLGSTLKILYFPKLINEKFYLYFLSLNKKYLRDNKRGAAIPHLDKEIFFNLTFPLPPLAEQKRIVEKIEDLMPLVDEYEKNWQKLEDINKKFPEDMKKSLLQEAIRGKLVEQRPEEGSGEELYRLIQEEKEKLIKEGKIKKQKALPEITEDEIPFDIPESWKWVRINDCIDVRDGTHDTPKYVEEGYPLVTSKNLKNGDIDFSNCKFISKEDHLKISERSRVDVNDILFAMIGSIGNPVKVQVSNEFSIKNMALFKSIRNYFNMDYLYWFLYSSQYDMKKIAYGAVQSFVSLKFLREYLLPLPPLAEQKRIVEKLEDLLPLCDQLIKSDN